eukprot:comp15476_c0_seq1/m.12463 comp15476_c0_seq1/g.12463  ORF comp15476_c0_seq1/g.12463 comp15476_c0_seq1/m.12463 type:complete len:164 (-) comp15476_c0_seq1:399-890(-)
MIYHCQAHKDLISEAQLKGDTAALQKLKAELEGHKEYIEEGAEIFLRCMAYMEENRMREDFLSQLHAQPQKGTNDRQPATGAITSVWSLWHGLCAVAQKPRPTTSTQTTTATKGADTTVKATTRGTSYGACREKESSVGGFERHLEANDGVNGLVTDTIPLLR